MPRTPPACRRQSKHWVFTINNPIPELTPEWNPQEMQYLVFGREEAPGTRTPHLQGYVSFHKRKRRTQLSGLWPTAFVQIAYGTPKQASDYCKKDGDWEEYGTLPKTQRQAVSLLNKTRWDDSYKHAKEGQLNLIPKDMLLKYYHAFKRVHQDNPPPVEPLEERDNIWIVAPTGYGKSTYARTKYPDYYDKGPNKWFVGYKNQSTILCDDFGPEQCRYLGWYIKRWADVFPFPAETKGGGKTIRPKHIVVTSQYTIDQCWLDQDKVAEAIYNRFKVIHLERWQTRKAAELLQIQNIEDRFEEVITNYEGALQPTERLEDLYSSEEMQISDNPTEDTISAEGDSIEIVID